MPRSPDLMIYHLSLCYIAVTAIDKYCLYTMYKQQKCCVVLLPVVSTESQLQLIDARSSMYSETAELVGNQFCNHCNGGCLIMRLHPRTILQRVFSSLTNFCLVCAMSCSSYAVLNLAHIWNVQCKLKAA